MCYFFRKIAERWLFVAATCLMTMFRPFHPIAERCGTIELEKTLGHVGQPGHAGRLGQMGHVGQGVWAGQVQSLILLSYG
jgi:hypothetical protein